MHIYVTDFATLHKRDNQTRVTSDREQAGRASRHSGQFTVAEPQCHIDDGRSYSGLCMGIVICATRAEPASWPLALSLTESCCILTVVRIAPGRRRRTPGTRAFGDRMAAGPIVSSTNATSDDECDSDRRRGRRIPHMAGQARSTARMPLRHDRPGRSAVRHPATYLALSMLRGKHGQTRTATG